MAQLRFREGGQCAQAKLPAANANNHAVRVFFDIVKLIDSYEISK